MSFIIPRKIINIITLSLHMTEKKLFETFKTKAMIKPPVELLMIRDEINRSNTIKKVQVVLLDYVF